jgi:hypothetical protein
MRPDVRSTKHADTTLEGGAGTTGVGLSRRSGPSTGLGPRQGVNQQRESVVRALGAAIRGQQENTSLLGPIPPSAGVASSPKLGLGQLHRDRAFDQRGLEPDGRKAFGDGSTPSRHSKKEVLGSDVVVFEP